MTRIAPRLTIHANGTATLSGIPTGDLKSILTAASLHHYETEKAHKSKEVEKKQERDEDHLGLGDLIWANHLESGAWVKRIRNILTLCDRAFEECGFRPTWIFKRALDLTPYERTRRKVEAESEKRFRTTLRQIIADALARRAGAN